MRVRNGGAALPLRALGRVNRRGGRHVPLRAHAAPRPRPRRGPSLECACAIEGRGEGRKDPGEEMLDLGLECLPS